jgi:hypothetical protein
MVKSNAGTERSRAVAACREPQWRGESQHGKDRGLPA